MAAIIFVKKLLSTRSPKLRLLCRLIIFFNVLGKRCANVFGNCVNNQSGFSRIRHVAKLLVGVRSDTPISFRSSLSVRFLVKVKFLSIFWRCVIRAHRKNSSLESFRIFLIYHTCDLTARMHCATEKNTMQQRYTAQH